MSDMRDKAQAADRFDAIVKKDHGLLTREERRLLALRRAMVDAQFAHDNAVVAAKTQTARAAELQVAAAKATQEFETARAAMEAK